MDAIHAATRRILGELEPLVQNALESGLTGVGAAEQAAFAFGKRASEWLLAEVAQQWGTGHVGPLHQGEDGVVREFHRHGGREVLTLAGPLRLRRAYYRDQSGRGEGGVFPLDARVGLGKGGVSRALGERLAELGAWMPFEEAAHIVEGLTGLAISAQTMRRTTEQIGKGLLALQQDDVEITLECPKAIKREIASDRIAITLDGTMAHVGGDWREVKIGAAYHFDECGKQVRNTKRYVSCIGPPSKIKGPLTLEAMRIGAYEATDLVAIGDGAPWIWNVVDELFPAATQVLDFYHAMEHVGEVAKARFGANTKKRRSWTAMVKSRLRHDGVDWFIRHLRKHARIAGEPPPDCAKDDPRAVLASNAAYFHTNRNRMLYQSFRKRGFPIGSGVVEGACKSLVGTRLKAAGMRWSQLGAERVLAVRELALTRQLDQRLRQVRNLAQAA